MNLFFGITVPQSVSDNLVLRSALGIGFNILMIIGIILFYLLHIKNLSNLIDRPHDTDWKIFVIPPMLFILLYSSIVMTIADFLNGQAAIILQSFSILIMYLFIWTFYVIIKNINATGEAIKAKNEVKTLSVEVMEALAHTIDAKDEYTRGHSVRFAKYSRMLAAKMGMSEEDCENVYYMGLLHDIGKIGVPSSIINSPDKLTDDEYDVVKTHPCLGYDILAEIKSRPDLSIGARWHHERFDGKGYPDGRAGNDIPFFARIISVADSYDAMTSNRSYRSYMPQAIVRSEIEKNAGTQFDPEIARCMLELIDDDTDYALHE
ncbi:MAG: HD-GYP domain-containing protein [Lachnospiraceae bacterium]|nr:HD-GYP domain-containing protein [Lachnospiraceae bacterium]